MRWKAPVGFVAAQAVNAVAWLGRAEGRGLTPDERAVLEPIYRSSVDCARVRIRERVGGLLAISGRAFVIENTLFLPERYLPLRPSVLVHELCHVWQHQNGGHAYIADSVHAQLIGDGYRLAKGLAEGRAWYQLNCEQQATLIEEGYSQGALDGGPFVVAGIDRTRALRDALVDLRAGRGAHFGR